MIHTQNDNIHKNQILYPALAMFLLTVSCMVAMGCLRYRAVSNRSVSIGYYRTYDKGSQPPYLVQWQRHVQNHFEVPPLFYVAVILLYVTDAVSLAAIGLAWLFVAARGVHSCIHLGSNNVSHRFFVFGASLLVLVALWLLLFVSIATTTTTATTIAT